ncbi:MAG: protein-glutamate O-methyltransferase CheR [Alphaproteobacteria bacterium]|nr:protein-glutamate O-methyltransferase CheR [Alphaproteobacteria bacterium]
MKPEDFQLLCGILKERSGLVLTPDKTYLLESRLAPLARKQGLADLDELIKAIRTRKEEKLLNFVTEAMTTNESLFFRDMAPFDQLRKTILPRILAARSGTRRIRIWSAACSTGQELYSIAMYLKEEAASLAGWRIDILATDLATEALEKAKAGLYSQFEVQRGLPIQQLMKNFTKVGDMWQASPALRAMVQFQTNNLLTDLGPLNRAGFVGGSIS